MPYCPVCSKNYSEETKTCPDHQVELVDTLPYQTIEGPDHSTWVEIAGVGTEDEARILQGYLEAEGIAAQIESLKFHMEPVNFGGLGEIRIYVRSDDGARALELLRSRELEYDSLEEDEVSTEHGPADVDEQSESVAETEEEP